ncbi:MAG: ubiquitin carboxyl-terminal hydrolase [Verrucomicrobia bacterium]|nr:ubiquitin carboxyl-terminal hydrolase [Verrucomicrobiota bacterium]
MIPSISSSIIALEGKGIANSGNSCYMAATIQGLLQVSEINKKICEADVQALGDLAPFQFLKLTLSPLFGTMEPKRALTTSETEEIRTFFRNNGWQPKNPYNQIEDPANFLRFFLSLSQQPTFAVSPRLHKKALNHDYLLSIPARTLNHPTSLQDLVTTYRLSPETIPELLPVVIDGRTMEGMSKNREKIFPSQQLTMSLQGDKEEHVLYDLSAVIVYLGGERTGGHYLTYVPEEDAWVEYNDSSVTRYVQSKSVEETIEEHSYIYFYSRV